MERDWGWEGGKKKRRGGRKRRVARRVFFLLPLVQKKRLFFLLPWEKEGAFKKTSMFLMTVVKEAAPLPTRQYIPPKLISPYTSQKIPICDNDLENDGRHRLFLP